MSETPYTVYGRARNVDIASLERFCLGVGSAAAGSARDEPLGISRVSVNSKGAAGDSFSDVPSVSGEGRYVAFVSGATNLVNR